MVVRILRLLDFSFFLVVSALLLNMLLFIPDVYGGAGITCHQASVQSSLLLRPLIQDGKTICAQHQKQPDNNILPGASTTLKAGLVTLMLFASGKGSRVPFTIRQRSLLYERFLDSFLIFYLSQLSTSVLVEYLSDAVEAISVVSGAGDDDGDRGDRRTQYDPFPYDFSVYPETGATNSVNTGQWLNQLVNAGINQKSRLLSILRTRLAEAFEAGNRDMESILRDRIMVIEADWQDTAQWLQHTEPDHSRDAALIASLINRLMSNTLEVQDYEDASLVRMVEQSPVFLSDNLQTAIIVVNYLDQKARRAYASWQRTASGMLYRELKKRLGRLLQTASPDHGVLINLITNLETLVRQFNRYRLNSVGQHIKNKPAVNSFGEPVDADPQKQGSNKSTSSNQDRKNSCRKHSGDGSGQASNSSKKKNNDGDDGEQNPNGRCNSLSTNSPAQAELGYFINAFVAAAGNGDQYKIQSFLSTKYKKELLLGQSKQFYGDTALHAAIRNQHLNIVQIIDNYCASERLEQLYSIQNDEGKMPHELAGETPLPYELQHSSVADSTAESASYHTHTTQGDNSQPGNQIPGAEELFRIARKETQQNILNLLAQYGVGIFWHRSIGDHWNTALHIAFNNDGEPFIRETWKYLGEATFRQLLQLTNDEGKTPLDVGSQDFVVKVLDSMGDTLEAIKQNLQKGNPHTLNRSSDGEVYFESFGEFQPCSFHTGQRCFSGLFIMPCCSTGQAPKFICDKGILKIIQNTLKEMRKYIHCCLCKKKLQIIPVLENARISFSIYQLFLEKNKTKQSYQDALHLEHQITGMKMLTGFCETTCKTAKKYLDGRRLFDNSLYYVEDAECCICLTIAPGGCFAFPACNHPVCMECWRQLFQISSTDINALSDGLCCPGQDCKTQVPEHVIEFLNGSEALAKINAILMKMAVSKSQDLFYCLVEDCDHVMVLDQGVQGSQQCPKCEKTFCAQCMITPGHEGLDCETYRKSLTKSGAESLFNRLVQTTTDNYKMTPCCKVIVYKTKGCDHMKCPRCHHNFSWRLQKKPPVDGLHDGKMQPANDKSESSPNDSSIDAVRHGGEMAVPCQMCDNPTSILLLCLHHLCDKCYRSMIQASTKRGDFFCTLCAEQNPDESGLLSEATGYTNRVPQRSGQRNAPVNKQCLACDKSLCPEESGDICSSCLERFK